MRRMTREEFFESRSTGLSYDDVLVMPGECNFDPGMTSLQTRFSRRLESKIPLISAPMDKVTDARMAIALAELGGVGVIHRLMSVGEQADEVNRVKRRMSAIVDKPVYARDTETIGNVLAKREKMEVEFHTFPVIDADGKLVGLLTRRHFEMRSPSDKAGDVMATELVTASPDVTNADALALMLERDKKVLPLVDGLGRLVALRTHGDIVRVLGKDAGSCNIDDAGRLIVAAAVGTGDEALERAEALVAKNVDALVIDSAHGNSQRVKETLRQLVDKYPAIDIVAGNVVTHESALALAECGAAAVKVGIGPGSICTTRIVSGCGRGQLTSVHECARALSMVRDFEDIPVIADGGARYPGDFTKAIAAGASNVMVGSMLAGTYEAPGDAVTIDGKPYKVYRGMGSVSAIADHVGASGRYGHRVDSAHVVAEGIEGAVPYIGSLVDVVSQIMGGLRQGLYYSGQPSLEDLRNNGTFEQGSSAVVAESHPHDITAIRD